MNSSFFRPRKIEKMGFACTMAFGKNDSGLVIMEDLKDINRLNGPMYNWDKTKIVDISVAKIIMKKLAIFHGIWLSWLHNQNPKTLGNVTRENIEKCFKMMKITKRGAKDIFNTLK